MTLTVLAFNEHQIIKLVHSLISITFLIVAIWLFYRSLGGYFKNRDYTRLDKILSYTFIVNLYLQLIFGFLLMAYPAPGISQELVNQGITMKMASKRFWPIEHIVLMLFALFIANLGLIFSNSTQIVREKHRKVLIYYAIAIVLIFLSLASTYLE
ncbi:MAG: hypothetical protein M1445_02805 [Bacteroidetes bacterium]|nr:hypothetical protein [Bacteroidota bacterium]